MAETDWGMAEPLRAFGSWYGPHQTALGRYLRETGGDIKDYLYPPEVEARKEASRAARQHPGLSPKKGIAETFGYPSGKPAPPSPQDEDAHVNRYLESKIHE